MSAVSVKSICFRQTLTQNVLIVCMSIVCPTVTAYNLHQYRQQIELVNEFAARIHIDLMDGEFAPVKSPEVARIWWPQNAIADIHLMYLRPLEAVDTLIKLKPAMVIIHAEADTDHRKFAAVMHENGIKTGLALLPMTEVKSVSELLEFYDQALIFSGNLGHHGGEADLSLLSKVSDIRAVNSDMQLAWDGGINASNAHNLLSGGIEVLNVGGYIHGAKNPKDAYGIIEAISKDNK